MLRHLKFLAVLFISLPLLAACDEPVSLSRETADRIFINGKILTMNPESPTAQAVAVKDGRILAVGSTNIVSRFQGDNTQVTELNNKTLMPGFFQTHAHFPFIAMKSQLVNIDPPPSGDVVDMESLIAKLQTVAAKTPAGQPVFAIGYDDTLMKELRHPTKFDLDKVSTKHPVFLVHISFHFATMNSYALKLVNVTADTPNPEGGIIRRVTGSQEPDGVFEEAAMVYLEKLMPKPDPQQIFKSYTKTMYDLAAKGYTTLVDHASMAEGEQAYQAMAKMQQLPLDLVAYRRLASEEDPKITPSLDYDNHYRLGGYKIVLDGSLQGYTGYLTKPYHVIPPHQHDADHRGYPHLPNDTLEKLVLRAFEENVPLLVHTNGDAATDVYLTAVEKARAAYPKNEIRPVIIHAQTMREDQIDKAQKMDMIASFFVDHVYFWGDRHREVFLGPDRAARISPTASSLRKGLAFTLHDDAPIVAADPLRSAWVAVNRQTSSGQILGPDQRITAFQALKALTLDAAYQHFEENDKGSIEIGKRADMIILDNDPTRIDPMRIKDIQVLETIKDGQTVFVKN